MRDSWRSSTGASRSGRSSFHCAGDDGADPFTPRLGADIERLRGTNGRQDLFRLRVGKFRAVYAVVKREVLVTDLFERGAGYEV